MYRTWPIVALWLTLVLAACGGGEGITRPDGWGDAVPDLPDSTEATETLVPDLPGAVDSGFDLAGDLPGTDWGIPDGAGPGIGETGWSCEEGADCNSGFCILTSDGKQCTQTCEEECPLGWLCLQYTPSLPDQVFLCAPAFLGLCRPCRSNAECMFNGVDAGERCLSYGAAGGFCGGACGEGKPACPPGYLCEEGVDLSGASAQQCHVEGGPCECAQLAIDQAASTDCRIENEWGSCWGERACVAEGLTECSAPVPAEESCNGADDDCDGEVDEGTGGAECFVTNQFGACPGTVSCVDGASQCNGPAPKAELCDGIDNDCDGEVDEGFPDTDDDGIADCLEADKDGDGIPDGLDNCPSTFNPGQSNNDLDAQGDVCDLDDDNDLTSDDQDCAPLDPEAHPGAQETCDGKDNDCNGLVDEGFVDTDADGWKDCVDKDDDNDGSPDETDCGPTLPAVHPGAAELCDGADNNCNQQVDEGYPDMDGDGAADCVDGDADGDQVPGPEDNCPLTPNPDQADLDADGVGDACDADDDGDSIPDGVDNCPLLKNTLQGDIDGDGLGDLCDPDMDGDGAPNGEDNCPLVANPGQADADLDGIGDACEDDTDGDGTPDAQDCAPLDPMTYPGASEKCDGADNDCDLLADEGFPDFDADGVKNCVDEDDDDDGDPDDGDCAPLDAAVHHLADELCDGKDNDCNGLVDDGFPLLTCGKGVCAHSVQGCVGGVLQLCDPSEGAAEETCDGLDNDCDGLLDEDQGSTACGLGVCAHVSANCVGGKENSCDPLAGAGVETCDGLDNDCDGKTDEDQPLLACGKGQCFHTQPSCIGGQSFECDPFKGALAEGCDGLDNDCDGETDEGLGATTCGFGECEHTVDNCKDGAVQICNPFVGAKVENCDSLDNDCDGLVDEDLGMLTCGLGICQKTVPACVDGEPGVCDPLAGGTEEFCGDGLDNDCDGKTDMDCGPDGTGVCIGKVCCNMACDGPCVSCELPDLVGTCTAYEAGSDPEEECGVFECDGSVPKPPGSSACFVECTEEQAPLQCKPEFHCDDGDCIPDLDAGEVCDEDSDCVSGACVEDWDGDGLFCADGPESCVDDDDGVLGFHPDGWVECDGGSGYRTCQQGAWQPAAPEGPVACGAALCDQGCGYVDGDDNACVSGASLGEDGGCEFEDLAGAGTTCIDCGDYTASLDGCNSDIASCSTACGAACEAGETLATDDYLCWADADGDRWQRVDACATDGLTCDWQDDAHAGDLLEQACGDLDCVDGSCLVDCGGVDASCNTGFFCGPDDQCYETSQLPPWAQSGSYLVLTKEDGTYFDGSDCPGNFFGKNETTVAGVPFRVGPYLSGGSMAGITPNKKIPAPYGSWTVQHAYYIFPGGRCTGQPLQVTFNYADGSSGATGTASIPHDCSSAGTWSGSNYTIQHMGTYGGPCCDHWYIGTFSNPNPGKAVVSFSATYFDGCGGGYPGQLWAVTID